MTRWPSSTISDAATIGKVSEMLTSTPPLGYANCCAAVRDMDQREPIRSITNPVLVIVGTLDPATPPAVGREIAEAIHGAQLVELEAAHLSNLEQPAAFTGAVLDFLTA
jgi:3-oxoadipate enol-lactonase